MPVTEIIKHYKRHYELNDGLITNESEDPIDLSGYQPTNESHDYTLKIEGDYVKFRTESFIDPNTNEPIFVDYMLEYRLGDGYSQEMKDKEQTCFNKHCSCCADELFCKDASCTDGNHGDTH